MSPLDGIRNCRAEGGLASSRGRKRSKEGERTRRAKTLSFLALATSKWGERERVSESESECVLPAFCFRACDLFPSSHVAPWPRVRACGRACVWGCGGMRARVSRVFAKHMGERREGQGCLVGCMFLVWLHIHRENQPIFSLRHRARVCSLSHIIHTGFHRLPPTGQPRQ